MGATWYGAGTCIVAAVLLIVAYLLLRPPPRELGEERGDYRLRRTGRRWTVERTWHGQWRPVAPPAAYQVAHAFYCELTDWQAIATNPMRDVMRESVPAAARRNTRGSGRGWNVSLR